MNGWRKVAVVGVVCGGLAGCLSLAAGLGTAGGLVLVYLTQLPLFIAGLWLGPATAALAGAVGAVVLLAGDDPTYAALFFACDAAPVVVLVRQALLAQRRENGEFVWYPPGVLTGWLAGFALSGIAIALVAFGGPIGLHAALQGVVSELLTQVAAMPAGHRDQAAAGLATILPGMMAASWMIGTIVNAVLAQGLLVRFARNWRPSPNLVGFRLPVWIPAAFGLAVLTTMFGAGRLVAISALFVLSVPFGLAGVAVLHAAARRLAQPLLVLVCFYVAAMAFGWPFLVVAVLGIADSWLGLQRRLAPTQG